MTWRIDPETGKPVARWTVEPSAPSSFELQAAA
jgi:hypothetical protein